MVISSPMQNPVPDRIQRAHDAADEAGQSGYLDPDTQLFVMTAGYLTERGYCCGSGCRHCPYPPEEQDEAGRPR